MHGQPMVNSRRLVNLNSETIDLFSLFIGREEFCKNMSWLRNCLILIIVNGDP